MMVMAEFINLQKQLAPEWIQKKAAQGLFPRSGNWYYPYRWVSKEDLEKNWGKENASKLMSYWDNMMHPDYQPESKEVHQESDSYRNNADFREAVDYGDEYVLNWSTLQGISQGELVHDLVPYFNDLSENNPNSEIVSLNSSLVDFYQILHEEAFIYEFLDEEGIIMDLEDTVPKDEREGVLSEIYDELSTFTSDFNNIMKNIEYWHRNNNPDSKEALDEIDQLLDTYNPILENNLDMIGEMLENFEEISEKQQIETFIEENDHINGTFVLTELVSEGFVEQRTAEGQIDDYKEFLVEYLEKFGSDEDGKIDRNLTVINLWSQFEEEIKESQSDAEEIDNFYAKGLGEVSNLLTYYNYLTNVREEYGNSFNYSINAFIQEQKDVVKTKLYQYSTLEDYFSEQWEGKAFSDEPDKLVNELSTPELMRGGYEDINEYAEDISRFDSIYNKDTSITLFHLKAMMQYQKGSSVINTYAFTKDVGIYDKSDEDASFLEHTIRSLDSAIAFAGMPNTDRDVLFRRGVSRELYKYIYDSFLEKGEYTNPSFMSTTYDLGVATEFGRAIDIVIPPQTIPYLDINDITGSNNIFSNEKEVILPRNIKFKVTLDEHRNRLVLTAQGYNPETYDVKELTVGDNIGKKLLDNIDDSDDERILITMENMEYLLENEENSESFKAKALKGGLQNLQESHSPEKRFERAIINVEKTLNHVNKVMDIEKLMPSINDEYLTPSSMYSLSERMDKQIIDNIFKLQKLSEKLPKEYQYTIENQIDNLKISKLKINKNIYNELDKRVGNLDRYNLLKIIDSNEEIKSQINAHNDSYGDIPYIINESNFMNKIFKLSALFIGGVPEGVNVKLKNFKEALINVAQEENKRERGISKSIKKLLLIDSIEIGDNKFKVLMPKNPFEGLGGRDDIEDNQGMLFLEPPKNYSYEGKIVFTMDKMKFPLDFIAINSDNEIVHIESGIEPNHKGLIILPDNTVAVFEVKAGMSNGIDIGDNVKFDHEEIFGDKIEKQLIRQRHYNNVTPQPEKTSGYWSEGDKIREMAEAGVLNWLIFQGLTENEWLDFQEHRKNLKQRKKDRRKTKRRKDIEALYEHIRNPK